MQGGLQRTTLRVSRQLTIERTVVREHCRRGERTITRIVKFRDEATTQLLELWRRPSARELREWRERPVPEPVLTIERQVGAEQQVQRRHGSSLSPVRWCLAADEAEVDDASSCRRGRVSSAVRAESIVSAVRSSWMASPCARSFLLGRIVRKSHDLSCVW